MEKSGVTWMSIQQILSNYLRMKKMAAKCILRLPITQQKTY